MAAFLQRNINRCTEAMETLWYQIFVRSIDVYASTELDPSSDKNIKFVEICAATQQCDPHDRKSEMGDPCEQAG